MINVLQKKTGRALEIWREQGWRGLRRALEINHRKLRAARDYQRWIREFDTLSAGDREKIRRRIENFSHRPLISVILPVYNVEEKWLRLCVESVRRQLYENWELCIADDCSPTPRVREILEEYASADARIKVTFHAANGHISAASNSALELATGEFAVLLDHDDELAEHALYFVAEEISRFSEVAMIYSDEDMIDARGRRYDPKFKPDWSTDFINSLNLITHLSAYRTEILRRVGGFRLGTEGSQDYDLALRVTEQINEHQIRHIPHILYHWRAIQGSVALSGDEKPYAHERAREAIRAHLTRIGKRATVAPTANNLHRVRYELPENLPRVSLLSAAKDENSLRKLAATTSYENFEILRAGGSDQGAAAGLNHFAAKASGDVFVFLDGDFEPLESFWLGELVGLALQKEIGAVGAKILDADGRRIRHGGIILGAGGLIGFANRGLHRKENSSFLRAQLINNFSAVAGVLAVRREVFEAAAGGFDAESFPNGLFDVDFCLRLREKNLRVVFTPYAELSQLSESSAEKILTDENAPEAKNFKKRWAELIAADPFYNPNLSLENERFQIALPPRVGKPWLD